MAKGDITSGLLSGSTSGRGISVAATSTPGTTIHTAVSGSSFIDRITIYASNHSTTVSSLTLEWGGTSSSDQIVTAIPATSEFFKVAEDLPLNGGLIVKAFADVTAEINLFGFVHQEQIA